MSEKNDDIQFYYIIFTQKIISFISLIHVDSIRAIECKNLQLLHQVWRQSPPKPVSYRVEKFAQCNFPVTTIALLRTVVVAMEAPSTLPSTVYIISVAAFIFGIGLSLTPSRFLRGVCSMFPNCVVSVNTKNDVVAAGAVRGSIYLVFHFQDRHTDQYCYVMY